jgi:hypothetical protein
MMSVVCATKACNVEQVPYLVELVGTPGICDCQFAKGLNDGICMSL